MDQIRSTVYLTDLAARPKDDRPAKRAECR